MSNATGTRVHRSHLPLVAAATGGTPSRRPVWFMRQAGRSLPEYRAIRANHGMLESCFDPELVCEITMQPVRRHDVDAAILFSDIVVPLKAAGIDFNASMIFGGQIAGEAMRMFLVYSAGNFIEATRETCFFQIGESKYGKPILDRVLTPRTPLDEAAKCALVSMDSTLKSNLSVGLPLDLLVYERDRYETSRVACIDDSNPYFGMIRGTWGQRLREVFEGIDSPRWDGGQTEHPLMVASRRYEPMKKIAHPGEKIV